MKNSLARYCVPQLGRAPMVPDAGRIAAIADVLDGINVCGGCFVVRGLTSIGVSAASRHYVSTVVSTMIN
jgi:hypothetical protein